MVKTQYLVRRRSTAGFARKYPRLAIFSLSIFLVALVSACTSNATLAEAETTPAEAETDAVIMTIPHFDLATERMIAHDGAQLGLTVWHAQTSSAPDHVIVGLHGMNDYANAFHMAAPYWAARGVTTYAYDQRGFGRSPGYGVWPDEDLMREDLRTATRIARGMHPDATITVVGISMGGAVAMSAFGSDRPPEADQLILSGPGLRGWGAMNPLYRASLWSSTKVRPDWVVRPPSNLVRIEPSDNKEMLRRSWNDPIMQKQNTISQVFGVVTLMETAHRRADDLPPNVPTLMAYGAKDLVIPPSGVRRTARILPAHIQSVYYENGYHMLLRDLQAETVYDDYLAFMHHGGGALPSGAPPLPWQPNE